jgi:hypothetical protein
MLVKLYMKNKRVNFISLIILIFNAHLLSCAPQKENILFNKNGSYKVSTIKTLSNSAVIYGTVYRYNSKEPIAFPAIQIDEGNKLVKGSADGKYKNYLIPGKHKFTGKGIHYQFCETQTINVAVGDSIELIFHLKPYDKPLND